jgi:hypothetical protein
MRVVAELRRAGVAFFHVPNEGKHSPQYRAKLARLGVSPGVPDLIIVTPPPKLLLRHGAALELKAPRGRASKAQVEWLEEFGRRGWATAVTYDLDEALGVLRLWGYL